MSRFYVTTTVHAPGLTHALELVQADVLARQRRLSGARVRFLAAPALRDTLTLSSNESMGPAEPELRAADISGGQFQLSRHACAVRELVVSGRLSIEPARYRDEVLGMEMTDIPVPEIPVGYLTSLGDAHYQRWWANNDNRVHVIGAESLRQHAVYWPAMLLSAGMPVPTHIYVHAPHPGTADPRDLVHQYGDDAVRWWLLRSNGPKYTAAQAHKELTKGLGTLIERVTVMVHRYRHGRPPTAIQTDDLRRERESAPAQIDDALAVADFRRATSAVWNIVTAANLYLVHSRPWDLAQAEQSGNPSATHRLDTVLTALLTTCRSLANQLTPFLPTAAQRIADQCFGLSGDLPQPRALFPRPAAGLTAGH